MNNTLSKDDVKDLYHKSTIAKITFILIIFCIVAFLAIFSLSVNTGVDFGTSYSIIYKHITHGEMTTLEWIYDQYLWDEVMPSIVMALVTGIGLAVGGATMQALTSNPLADAYTTGISSGACLGAVSAIIVGSTYSAFLGQYGLISMAFVGGLVPALIVIFLSRFIGNSPATLILLGIAISYFFNGMVTFLMVTTDTDSLQSAYMWQIGSLTKCDWDDLTILTPIIAVFSVLFMLLSGKLNIITLGDASAKSLGVDVQKFRFICLILVAFIVSATIAFTGIMGFIGLVSPHIARFIVGDNNKYVLPAGMAIGMLFLTVGNILSRYLLDVANVPVGIVMSFIGAPVFLYLIIRKKSEKVVY